MHKLFTIETNGQDLLNLFQDLIVVKYLLRVRIQIERCTPDLVQNVCVRAEWALRS